MLRAKLFVKTLANAQTTNRRDQQRFLILQHTRNDFQANIYIFVEFQEIPMYSVSYDRTIVVIKKTSYIATKA